MSAKRKPPMAYFEVRRLVDPRTGEEVGAFVPRSKQDRDLIRSKRLAVGSVVRMPIRKPRNEKFNRLAHGLGTLVVEQIEGFENDDAHSAIKRLQHDADVMCQCEEFDVPGLGKLQRRVARSLAFDEMDEAEFHLFWQGICRHIVARYWPGIDPETIEAMIPLMPEHAA